MEEENRKGPSIFYAVVSVATLVVAIIGATFAYFSSTIGAQDDKQLEGNTLNIGEGGTVTLAVAKVDFPGVQAGSNDLVPAKFDSEPGELTDADVNAALKAKCEEKGYTGCHLWKLTVHNDNTLATASIKLNLETTAKVKDDWSYALFTATGDVSSTLTASEVSSKGKFASDITAKTENSLAQGDHDYYVLIYLKDNNQEQDKNDDKDATGTYTGTVTLEIAGSGQNVTASFAG